MMSSKTTTPLPENQPPAPILLQPIHLPDSTFAENEDPYEVVIVENDHHFDIDEEN